MIFVRDFNRDRNSGGGRDFKRRDFDRPQEMHQAICSNCGKTCEVPFKPNGSKPVFCRECFQSNRTGGESRRPNFEDRNNNFPPPPPRFDDRGPHQPPADPHKEQLDALNSKLDKILSLLAEKQTVEKPVVVTPVAVTEPKVEKTEKLSVAKSSVSRTKSRAKTSGKSAKK